MNDPAPPSDRSWEEPGAYPVSPGVFRIPLPLPGDSLRAVNVYAAAGRRRDHAHRRRVEPPGGVAGAGGRPPAGRRRARRRAHRARHPHAPRPLRPGQRRAPRLGGAVVLGRGERLSLEFILDDTGRDRWAPWVARLHRYGADQLLAEFGGAARARGRGPVGAARPLGGRRRNPLAPASATWWRWRRPATRGAT